MLSYISLYTHRVAISNRRLVAYDHHTVTFNYKDYRAKGRKRYTTMRLATDEFIRRFLIHILPSGFHRIRHFGLFANHHRKQNLLCLRRLLGSWQDFNDHHGCSTSTTHKGWWLVFFLLWIRIDLDFPQ